MIILVVFHIILLNTLVLSFHINHISIMKHNTNRMKMMMLLNDDDDNDAPKLQIKDDNDKPLISIEDKVIKKPTPLVSKQIKSTSSSSLQSKGILL